MFTVAEVWEQPLCPLVDGWLDQERVCIQGTLLILRKKETLLFVTTWVDLEGVGVREIGEKNCMVSLTCGM